MMGGEGRILGVSFLFFCCSPCLSEHFVVLFFPLGGCFASLRAAGALVLEDKDGSLWCMHGGDDELVSYTFVTSYGIGLESLFQKSVYSKVVRYLSSF